MDKIKAFGFFPREMIHTHGNDFDVLDFDASYNFADIAFSDAIGFYYCECSFHYCLLYKLLDRSRPVPTVLGKCRGTACRAKGEACFAPTKRVTNGGYP